MSLTSTTAAATSAANEPRAIADKADQQHQQSPVWKPKAGASFVASVNAMTMPFDPEKILAVGAAGSTEFFTKIWEAQRASGRNEPLVTKAFIKAVAFSRRGRDAVSLVKSIGSYEHLDGDDLAELALVACDIVNGELAQIIFLRAKGTLRPLSVYVNLLRYATEVAPTVDMVFATEICAEMSRVGVDYYVPQVRCMIHGFGRMTPVLLKPIAELLRLRVAADSVIEECIVQETLAALERTSGPLAADAVEVLRLIPAAGVEEAISAVAHGPLSDACQPCCTSSRVTYILVDLCTTDITALQRPPANTFYVFLYSIVRQICVKSKLFAKCHQVHKKLADLSQLLVTIPEQCKLFPLDKELMVRSIKTDAPASTSAMDFSHHKRLAFFVECLLQRYTGEEGCSMTVLTADGDLTAHCSKLIAQFPHKNLRVTPTPPVFAGQ